MRTRLCGRSRPSLTGKTGDRIIDRRAFLVSGLALAACALPGNYAIPEGGTLILLRHADRDGEDLNREGRARAQALVAALEGIPIDAIYAPDIQRNIDTVTPLAEARGLKVTTIPADFAVRRLTEDAAGRTVVWVGNRDNLPEIWTALTAPGAPPVEYGELFFLRRGPLGLPQVERRHFGA